MDEARDRSEWNRISLICATFHNSNPFREGKPLAPDRFSPYAVVDGKQPAQVKPISISADQLGMMMTRSARVLP